LDVTNHDVLLVGGGGAGLRAAIAVSEFNPKLSVAVVSKVYPMRSHTVSAEGGAAAVIKPGDTLDEHAYDSGVCILEAPAFAKLWGICRERQLTVVGDVHSHGSLALQSEADRTNPMVARAGHVALIAPDFARPPVKLRHLGVYEYRGNHEWNDHTGRLLTRFFYVGWWS